MSDSFILYCMWSLCICFAPIWGTLAVLLSECWHNIYCKWPDTISNERKRPIERVTDLWIIYNLCNLCQDVGAGRKERTSIWKLRWRQGYHILFYCPPSADYSSGSNSVGISSCLSRPIAIAVTAIYQCPAGTEPVGKRGESICLLRISISDIE